MKQPSYLHSIATRILFCICLAATLLTMESVAQSKTLQLRGFVLDSSGAPVPEATVSADAANAPGAQSVNTDAQGSFTLDTPQSGDFVITVRKDGFALETRPMVTAGASSSSPLYFRLRPAVKNESITVTAARTGIPLTAMPNSAVVLEKETIDQQRLLSDDLAGVLEKTVPGFGPSLRKLTGRAESLRGRNPLYMINGVPQHNALRDGQRDGHTIDLDFVENVEVIQGSNSLQGIGATGGVVNMVTKSAPLDGSWRQDIRLALTSHDSFRGNSLAPKASYLLGKRVGRFDIVGGASVMKRNLFYDAKGQPIGLYPTQGDIMDSTSTGFYTRVGYELSGTQRISAMYNNYRLARDGDYIVVMGNRATGQVTSSAAGDPRPLVGDPARNLVHTASADYSNRNFLGGSLGVQGFYQDFAARFEGGTFGNFFRLTPDGPPFLDQSEVQSRKLGIKLTQSFEERLWNGFTPRVGLDFIRDESLQRLTRSGRNWVPPVTLRGLAPFLQLEQKFADRLTLTGGLRIERAGLLVNDYTTIAASNAVFVRGGEPSFTEVLPNAGAVLQLGRGFSVYASYSEGFTMPDAGRVLRDVNIPGQVVDSLLNLQPVVSNNTETGLRYRNGRLRAEGAYYWSNSSLGSLLRADQNGFFNVLRERTEISGFEFSSDLSVNRFLTVGGTYAWIEGRFDSNSDGRVDSDLDGMNIAPNRMNLFAQFFPTHWLYGRFQTSTLMDRDFRGPGAPANANFNGFTTADLALGFTTRAGLFRFGAENLFDKQYLTYFAQTEPFQRRDTVFAGLGRTFTITFEPRF